MTTADTGNGTKIRVPPDEEGSELMIPVASLHPNPDNPRLEAGDVTELASSIRKTGLLQSLLVRPAPEIGTGQFWIEAGYRRWVAVRSLGWRSVRCHVEPAVLQAAEATERNIMVGLIENLHRHDLDAVEKARAFGRLRDECHLSMSEIARRSGIHSSTVSTALALLELTPLTQEKVRKGELSTVQALQIVRRHRKSQRRKKYGGSGESGARWEPDWFARSHPLAAKAEILCDARDHNGRRRLGRVACGFCFEDVIRQDQVLMEQLKFRELMKDVLSPPWPDQGKTP